MKKNLIFTAVLLLILAGCSKNKNVNVEGEISNAQGKMLYFELFGMNSTEILDSVKLNSSGKFHFETKIPESPEFYRIRIDKRFIHLCADSAVVINIKANGEDFGKDYKVEGSRDCELIRQLSVLQGQTLVQTDSVKKLYDQKNLTPEGYQESLFKIFSDHREKAKKVIYEDPRSPAAYFALFQRFHNYLVFDPYDANDSKCYAAVATSWNTYYPDAVRSKHLVKLTLMGIKEIRKARDARDIKITETDKISIFEISLPDKDSKVINLSSLKGQVILLDFTAYQTDFSPSRNLNLRSIYNEFHSLGFNIFQVSLDNDEHFWKTGASNLPWICVWDRNSTSSEYLRTYNVSQIPTYFLIDRQGNIVARDEQIKDLKGEIKAML